jgi:hypothetical protein
MAWRWKPMKEVIADFMSDESLGPIEKDSDICFQCQKPVTDETKHLHGILGIGPCQIDELYKVVNLSGPHTRESKRIYNEKCVNYNIGAYRREDGTLYVDRCEDQLLF